MKFGIVVIALMFAILFPFVVNLLGWNIYAYFNFGEKDLILASSRGLSHNAWAERYEEDVTFGMELSDDLTRTILEVGFIELFLERRGDPMGPFTFRWIESDEYSNYKGFEFPWLLLLTLPFVVMIAPRLKRRKNKAQNSESDCGGESEA